MTGIEVIQCRGLESASIPEAVLANFQESFAQINNDAALLAKLAVSLRQNRKLHYCELPLGYTLEAEALGSVPVFDPVNGNRIRTYALTDLQQLPGLRGLDPKAGRMAEVLEAIAMLKKSGERIILNLSGSVSLGTAVMDSQLFFKAMRRNKPEFQDLLAKLEEAIIEFARAGLERGADIISLADPAGNLDILGPKLYKEVTAEAMVRLLKRVLELNPTSLIHLCGRTSASLEAVGLLKTEVLEVEGADYIEMLENSRQQGVRIAGHWCLKAGGKSPAITSCRLLES